MPNKPDRLGYQMFLLAGGVSGIFYDFISYTGKADESEYEFCTNIIIKLSVTVPRMMNYKLHFDNYSATIRLQVELKNLEIFSV